VRRVLSCGLCVLGVVLLLQGGRIYAKALVAQVLLRSAWEQARQGEARPRPWPWADTWAVARLRSLSHEVDLIVLSGSSGSTTAFGPGHITGTAPPGAVGNVGIAAHRDTHFAFLEQVQHGEQLWLELPDGRARAFSIDSTRVVHESDTSSLSEPVDGLTLVTCYPFHAANPGGPWRYVVRARAI
jgi:sortase A